MNIHNVDHLGMYHILIPTFGHANYFQLHDNELTEFR